MPKKTSTKKQSEKARGSLGVKDKGRAKKAKVATPKRESKAKASSAVPTKSNAEQVEPQGVSEQSAANERQTVGRPKKNSGKKSGAKAPKRSASADDAAPDSGAGQRG